jgi:class 3 adenylate cyclase
MIRPTITLPIGTVTFFFADIEGSTQRSDKHPEPFRLRHGTIR